MADKWVDVQGTLSEERERRIQARFEEEVKKLSLNQARVARSMSQVDLATVLNVNQGTVSKLEKRSDRYVSTLSSYIQAMGGELQIKAVFPDGEVEMKKFHQLAP
jgi:DNA-binding XRE family transcriptional regulator